MHLALELVLCWVRVRPWAAGGQAAQERVTQPWGWDSWEAADWEPARGGAQVDQWDKG